MSDLPEILAPAGDLNCALAGLAAGADALYLGLKQFSARMQSENFASRDLARLVDLAHSEGRKIFVALNTLIKPEELGAATRMIRRLTLGPCPDALIAQDPAVFDLARQAGFAGELHLSTLANVTHQAALKAAADLGASRVILPRELSLDEVRQMDAARPEGLKLEIFVHGALCFCVSGRCWWSAYLGGKSGLRGRCVQPCRRLYRQKGKEGRFFSCRDLSLDVLAKTLLDIPGLASWKIEGRRKGPHYVYYATTAYRMLRDEPGDSAVRREAERILGLALGRPTTHARFLPQRSGSPVSLDGQTSSGLLAGKLVPDQAETPAKGRAAKNEKGVRFILKPRFDLLPGDYLRIGYEDEPWHDTLSVTRRVPKGGSLTVSPPRHKTPKSGTPVFLIDRREPELKAVLAEWKDLFDGRDARIKEDPKLMEFEPALPRPAKPARLPDILLAGGLARGKASKEGLRGGISRGLWLSPKALDEVSRTLFSRIFWWLPPVIWPEEEDALKRQLHAALAGGARSFVCNAPWQAALFERRDGLNLIAGPFCNLSNGPAVAVIARLGFSAAIIGPELGREDILALPRQSPLPLGLTLSGYWPVGITRHGVEPLKPGDPFQSPKGEDFWARRHGRNTWIYPAWPLDLTAHRPELEAAGYSFFINIDETPPPAVPTPKRSSEFNWQIGML